MKPEILYKNSLLESPPFAKQSGTAGGLVPMQLSMQHTIVTS